MSWQGIEGHDQLVQRFRTAIERNRLASTFLFVGPEGVGKKLFALKLAQTLLCPIRPPVQMDPCGQCPACRQVKAQTHPDLILVGKPEDRSFIPLSLLIGPDDKRMQEGLCHDIGLRPYMGGRKIALLDDADYLNIEGANSLLKTLEEPPPHSLLILISTSAERQLPTIRSRCQLIRFGGLSQEVVSELLLQMGLAKTDPEAARLAAYSQGSLGRAKELADPQLWEFRRSLLEGLSARQPDTVALARQTSAFVDTAGRDAPPRRVRLRLVLSFLCDFYRQLLRAACGAELGSDQDLSQAIQQALPYWPDPERAAEAADRCDEAIVHIGRNLNQSTLIESFFDDLWKLHAGQISQRTS